MNENGFQSFFECLTLFSIKGLTILELNCILTIIAWLKSNINFDYRYLKL